MALITPAKSHPEVIIQAVAARDRAKAEKYAKSNDIPEVKGSYQGESGDDSYWRHLANTTPRYARRPEY